MKSRQRYTGERPHQASCGGIAWLPEPAMRAAHLATSVLASPAAFGLFYGIWEPIPSKSSRNPVSIPGFSTIQPT
jgi:hypothetical protein